MFRFSNQQEQFEISGVKFGGQPGKRRAVMIGSMFYPRHSVVKDPRTGEVDKVSVEQKLSALMDASRETGCPAAVAAYAETPEAMAVYLDMLASLTGLPILIDSSDPATRIRGARAAGEMGLQDRVVYNSLGLGSQEEEWKTVQDAGIRSAVVLAFNPKDVGVKGKIYILDDGDGLVDQGLIEKVGRYGVDRPLIDVAAMAMEQNAGSALQALTVAKAKWGLPVGCALHNTVESWSLLSGTREKDPKLFRYVDITASVLPMAAGADFVLYGPVEYARTVSYAASFADLMISQATEGL